MSELDAIVNGDTDRTDRETAAVELVGRMARADGSEEQTAAQLAAIVESPRGRSLLQSAGTRILEAIKDTRAETGALKALVRAMEVFVHQQQQQQLGAFDAAARFRLADVYEQAEEYIQSAEVLRTLGNASDDRSGLSKKERFHALVRIARCYLEVDQPENAAPFLSKAQYLRPAIIGSAGVSGGDSSTTPADDIHFRLALARVADAERRFLDAAQKYYSVSLEPAVAEADRLACLAQATLAAILAPAGPPRKDVLRRLHNDERAEQLPQRQLLDRAFRDQVLSATDAAQLETYLAPHQLAAMPDGTTVVSRALSDHNILAISRVYADVRIASLAALLELAPARTEAYVAKMVSQGRLAARIDQPAGVIYFRTAADLHDAASPFALADSSTLTISAHDDHVLQAFHAIDSVASDILDRYPDTARAALTP